MDAYLMPNITNRLKYLLECKRIENFLRQYQNLDKQISQVNEEDKKHLSGQYQRMKILMEKIERSFKELSQDTKNWIVGYMDKQKSSFIALKKIKRSLECKYKIKMKQGLQQLCQKLLVTEDYNKLFPFCQSAKDIKLYSQLEKDIFITFKVPFINERSSFVRLIAINRIEENRSIIIYWQGLNGEPLCQGEDVGLEFGLCQIKIKGVILNIFILANKQHSSHDSQFCAVEINQICQFILQGQANRNNIKTSTGKWKGKILGQQLFE